MATIITKLSNGWSIILFFRTYKCELKYTLKKDSNSNYTLTFNKQKIENKKLSQDTVFYQISININRALGP